MIKTCPTPDLLRLLLADQLGDGQEDRVGDHVEGCELCQEELERLTEAAVPTGRFGPSAEVAEFLDLLKQDPPAGLAPVAGLPIADDRASRPMAPDGYDILGELGRGGMGVVYKARHRRLGRTVALKMILDGAHAAPRDLDRFRREAEAIARLQHPNIVQIYDFGEHDGRPYLALEFVEGGSLALQIGGSSQSARRSAEVVRELARTVQEAHRAGIVHRDLKPANVLLTESGTPKITDFGIAKRLDGEVAFPTLSEQFLGTPSYMAPEQAVRERPSSARGESSAAGDGSGLSPSVDIYGLGAILYEMVTGRPPFHADSPLETVLQVLHDDPVAPTRLRPGVPRDLETICLKCLEKSPRRRYPTAGELADDLERFLDFEPVEARPVGGPERAWRWCRRKTSLALAMALAAIAIVAAIGLSISLAVYHYRPASRLGEALHEVQSRRRQVDQQSSHLAFEHGQALCEQGDVAQGVLWLVRGLKTARLAGDDDLERAFRLNLSAWNLRLHPLRVRAEHPGMIHDAAYGPDGRTIAIVGDDGTLQVRDSATGDPIGSPMEHPSKVGCVAFSPDGRTVLTGCDDFAVRLWDVKTGARTGPEWRHEDSVLGVAFSPDGRTIITGSADKTARLWDACRGLPIGQPLRHDGKVMAVAFSPDGRTLLTGSDDMKARLWDVASGSLRVDPLRHDGPVSVAAFSPDGRTIITGGWDRMVRVWDVKTGLSVTPSLRHEGSLRALAISRDGRAVLTGSYDRTAQLWDRATGKPIGPAFRHENQVWFVAFSPDGRTILSGGQENTAYLREVPTALETPTRQLERSLQIATGMELLDDGSIHLLDSPGWNERRARTD